MAGPLSATQILFCASKPTELTADPLFTSSWSASAQECEHWVRGDGSLGTSCSCVGSLCILLALLLKIDMFYHLATHRSLDDMHFEGAALRREMLDVIISGKAPVSYC